MSIRTVIAPALLLACLAGAARAQELGPVVITEIMYNPHGTDEGQEWIEVYNSSAATVDMSRWSIQTPSGRTGDIPNGTTLGPGQIAVIAPRRGGVLGTPTTRQSTYVNTQASWNAAWGTGIRVIFVESFWNYPGDASPVTGSPEGFKNDHDTIELLNRNRQVIDRVSYDSDTDGDTPWPDGNDSGSIQLLRDFCLATTRLADNNNGAAWRLSGPGDGLGSRLANTALPAFPGLNSYGTPGVLPNQLTIDCNGNGVNDAVDIVRGTAIDSFPYNNIPDSCEGDCNGNGQPDLTEILLDWRLDRNANLVLDACEINAHGGSGGIGGTLDTNNNGILDSFENKPNVVITEIMYDPNGDDEGKEFVEIYNPTAAPINISGWALKDIEGDPATGAIPAGIFIQPGEAIVLCAGSGPGVPANIEAQFRAAWNLPPSVRTFALNPWQDRAQRATFTEEVLALVDATGEPVDVADYENPAYAAGSTWPVDDTASSICLLPSALNKSANDTGSNWARSTLSIDGAYSSLSIGFLADIRGTGSVGSPGVVWTGPHQTATGEAVITEIMYHPNSNAGDPSRAEWLEIYNPGPTVLDLSGWYIRDEDGHTGPIAAGTTLAAGEVIVLIPQVGAIGPAEAETSFRAAWGDICHVAAITGWSDFEPIPNIGSLANNPGPGNEVISIRKADGTLVDEVNYDDANGWPADTVNAAPGLGTAWSIYLLPGHYSAVDNDQGVNWAAALQGIDQSNLNTMTAIFNGFDIGSPGLLEGVVMAAACASPPTCPADYNMDGVLNADDIGDFITGYFNMPSDAATDFNGDGVINADDLGDFITAYFNGC